jgi:(1->4)-alpha-D-glucan 1-alpha-D-glucosylmutase
VSQPRRIPLATYRLQLRKEFPLEAASATVPYLRMLGVSDLYLSPVYAAREGSVHGYDVIDHGRLNPELGDARALRQLLDQVEGAGMGVLLDVVPNHMCVVGDGNRLWMDVLENGRHSPCAAHFDIDWDPPKPELVGKVLLPFLEEQYGRVLEGGLAVRLDQGVLSVEIGGSRLPLALASWGQVLEPALEIVRQGVPAEDPGLIELESILRALTHALPMLTAAADGLGGLIEYRHEKEAIHRRLVAVLQEHPACAAAVTAALASINGRKGEPASFDALERLMNDQHYRLANWRVAAHEINYRRFFDVNELAAIRVECPSVFAEVHVLPFEIARHPAFTGFRVDHVDGLSDPEQYLIDLRDGARAVTTAPSGEDDDQDEDEDRDARRPFIVVEKILGPAEILPSAWDVDGTTGYEFMPILAGVLVRPTGGLRLRAVAANFSANPAAASWAGASAGHPGHPDPSSSSPQSSSGLRSFSDVGYESKRELLATTLAAELTVLARRLDRISEQHRYTRDFTLNHLQAALLEVVACFPVYRTYVRGEDPEISEGDRLVIGQAVAAARRRNPLINSSLFDFIESVLMRRDPPGLAPAELDERRTFETRFQQLTGPVCAKGIEDTAFYRYLPLLALNEVGGDPTRFGAPDADTHRALAERAQRSPHCLSATATHDTKRGEDTRARLYVLSEVADAWAIATTQWSSLNSALKTKVDGRPAPDPAEEYILYQTLAGSWPLGGLSSEPGYPQRIHQYMAKARHEAKTNTSWINPNPEYDRAADGFVDALMDPDRSGRFHASMESFVRSIARPGLWNGLAQVVLKVCAPGIPDFFQGSELWDFSLVDPDNRRLVDYRLRRAWLGAMSAELERAGGSGRAPESEIAGSPIEGWFDAPEDGRIKLWVTAAALRARRRNREALELGEYRPIATVGPAAAHVFAFARTARAPSSGRARGQNGRQNGQHAGQVVIAVVGRFLASFGVERPCGPAWDGNRLSLPEALAGRTFREVLTDRIVNPTGDGGLPLPDVFRHLPVAILESILEATP